MLYLSTGGAAEPVRFGKALAAGLAPDGGLYVPAALPRVDPDSLPSIGDLPSFAGALLAPFLEGDPLAGELDAICRAAFGFELPVTELGPDASVLELFHGPTLAFKDLGARFLVEGLARLDAQRRILVATSGDTGGAVAAACHAQPALELRILYPRGGVSERQERHLTCWGPNVRAYAVRGSFDDCQRLAKEAFGDERWPRSEWTSANSINIGRLLPQIVHHAVGALAARRRFGRPVDCLVPSGNLGNATAALYAKRMGLPIERVVLVTNANRVVAAFLESGRLEPRPSVRTLANAMDIGHPGNLARIRHLYESHADLRSEVGALSVSDDEIRAAITAAWKAHGRALDPHTATAFAALESLGAGPKLLVATAHPAKFAEIVEPLLGTLVEVPPAFAELLTGARPALELDPTLEALAAVS